MTRTNTYKFTHERYAILPSLLLFTPLLFALCGGPLSSVALAADASPTPLPFADASATPPPQAPSELGNLIAAGKLPDLRWPNFTDVQAEVVKFYALGADALAWLHDGQPTAQALGDDPALQTGFAKGPQSGRLRRLAMGRPPGRARPVEPASRPDTDLVHFDLALTVCATRYLSALHLGRVGPQHFKFGLDGRIPTSADLAEVLRNQVIQAQDVGAVVASVEPHYDGYGRAETALAAYLKLAVQGDGTPAAVAGQIRASRR